MSNDKKTKLQKLENLSKLFFNLKYIDNQLSDLFGFEGKVNSAYWECFESLMEEVAENCKINFDALHWFVWETEFGKDPKECIVDKKEILVKDIKSFLETI